MLTLNPSAEPFWLEILPGQRTRFRPIVTAAILAARAKATDAILKAREKDPDGAHAAGEEAFTRTIAWLGITEWEGVFDANGSPAETTKENIEAYLSNWRIFDAIDRLYVIPALIRTDEKNASSALPSGTSAAAANIARGASISKARAVKRAHT